MQKSNQYYVSNQDIFKLNLQSVDLTQFTSLKPLNRLISIRRCQNTVQAFAYHDVLCHNICQDLVCLQVLDEMLVHNELFAQNSGALPESPPVPLQHAALEHLPGTHRR